MTFSVPKAVVYGLSMFVGLAVGLTIAGGPFTMKLILLCAAAGAVFSAVLFGFLMRDGEVDLAGSSQEAIDAAIRSSWQLRTFKPVGAAGDTTTYQRGAGWFGDRVTATRNATGVILHGPLGVLRLLKKKAVA